MNIPKLIKLACNCIIKCYLQYMISNFAIFKISKLDKGVPSWLEKEKQLSWLGKLNIFCNALMMCFSIRT